MPYCPNCRYEYPAGIKHCMACGASLVQGKDTQKKSAPSNPLVVVRKTTDSSAAEVIQAALSEAGIPSAIQRQGPITGHLGRVTDGMTEDYALILVTEERLLEADALLTELEMGRFQWPEGMEPEDEESELEEKEAE